MRNATLADLADLLKDQQARKLDVVAPAETITAIGGRIHLRGTETVMDEDGVTATDGVYTPTAVFDEGLSDKLRIPLPYLRRMRDERPDLWDANVNGWLHGHQADEAYDATAAAEHGITPDPRRFLLRCFSGGADPQAGVARAFLSDTYKRIDNLDVLTAALAGVRDTGTPIDVLGADLTDRRMFVRVTAPGITAAAGALLEGYRSPWDGTEPHWGWGAAAREGQGYDPGAEPVFEAGFRIANSEVGNGRFTITPEFRARICNNGLTITADRIGKTHLGGKLDEGIVRWSDETQRQHLALVRSQATDAVRTFLDVDYLRRKIAELQAAAGVRLADPAGAVEKVGKALAFDQATTAGVLDHFIKGGQPTAAGLMNAVTSFAQTVPDADKASDLQDTAVQVLHLAAA